VPKDRAERLIHFVVHAANDDEGDDRLRAVRDTYARFAGGDEIHANFSALLKDETAIRTFVKTLDAWLDIRQRRFKIHNEHTLLSRPAAAFLVSGLLVKGSLISLIADPNVGKTFLATDLTFSIAAGSDTWLGRKLYAAGPVLYVIGEGLGRFGYRLLAWKHTRGVDRSLPFHWIDEPVPLLDEDAATAFVREVAPLKPSLVVFDTLSRCLMGGNENSQEDMGKAVAVCDELRARTGCAVIVVHHTRKDGTVERGSTVLRGAADTLLMLKEETRGILTLSCEKQKDADAFEPISLVRRSIQLDGVRDMSGEPASSCVIDVATGADTERAERVKKSRVLTFVREHPGTTRDDVCKALGGRRESVRAEIDGLVSLGELREEKDGKRKRVFVSSSPKLDM
jgi:AAA domain